MRNFKQQLRKLPWSNQLYFLRHYIIVHCIGAEDVEQPRRLLTDFGFIEEKIEKLQSEDGVNQLLNDYQSTIEKITNNDLKRILTPLFNAIRLSADALTQDPEQVFSQLYSRLQNEDSADLRTLLNSYTPSHPWLRSLSSTIISTKSPLLRTLVGHQETVLDCVISDDTKMALSASSDSTLRLWNLETGLWEDILRGHTDKVTACSLSADGCLALSASADKTLRFWDLRDTKKVVCLKVLEGHTDQVTDCALSRDGKRCVSCSLDETVRIWDVSADDNSHVVLRGHQDAVTCCSLSADSTLVLSGSFDKTLRLWKVETQECVTTIEDDGGIFRCALSPDGRFAFSTWEAYLLDLDARNPATGDTPFYIFYNADGKDDRELLAEMKDHFFDDLTGTITRAGITWEVMHEADKLRMWDLSSRQCVRKLEGHQTAISNFELSRDGKRIITSAANGTVKVWDSQTGQCLTTLLEVTAGVSSCAIDSAGTRALSSSYNGDLHLWDIPYAIENTEKDTGEHIVSSILDCAYDQKGDYALSVSASGSIQLWDGRNRSPISQFHPALPYSASITVSADSRRGIITPPFLTRSEEETNDLTVIDLQTDRVIAQLSGHTERPIESTIDRSGKTGLSASQDNTLRSWNIEKQQCLAVMEGHTGQINCCVLSADGSKGLSGADDTTVRVWDTKTGACLHVLQGHSAGIRKCVFSEDGGRGLSIGEDNTICLWDIPDGILLQQIRPGVQTETLIALSYDGQLVAYVTAARILHIVDSATAQKVTSFTFDSTINAVVFSPDHASIIMVGDGSGRVHFLRLEPSYMTSSEE